jgi:hypothetical protein
MTYDGLLRSRTAAALTTSFLWDPSVAPAPLLQAGTDRVVQGLGPLYPVRADATTITLVRDALGSVRAEAGEAGTITKAFRYAPTATSRKRPRSARSRASSASPASCATPRASSTCGRGGTTPAMHASLAEMPCPERSPDRVR